MYTLGIETSCDETSAAVIKDKDTICSQLMLSQIDLHKYFGGVIPELASRKHLETLPQLVTDAVKEAGISLNDLNLISVTQGPGLAGALLVGLSFAKALSYRLNIPFVGINHIEAHLYANFMEHPDLKPPCIGLIVSGGHTAIVEIKDIAEYSLMGQTLDDAAGEAFDKTAKLLKLGYPGGPIIDDLSEKGNPNAVSFPRAMLDKDNYDFSFSGLKTAVVYYVKGFSQFRKKYQRAEKVSTEDLAASFQEALIDQIVGKTKKAMKNTGYKTLILGGGVVRNSRLRNCFKEESKKGKWQIFMPSPSLCTDNAVMAAGLGAWQYAKQGPSPLNIDIKPRMEIA